MPQGALHSAALGVVLLVHGALAENAMGCFEPAKMFVDPALNGLPSGGYVMEESSCQNNCQLNPSCQHWTFKAVGNPLKGILDNGCWVLSGSPVLQDVNISDTPGRVVSGPKFCPTQVPSSTPPMLTTPQPIAVNGTSIINETIGTNGTNATFDAAIQGKDGGGFHWGILLFFISGVVIGIGALVVCCSGGTKKSSKKKKKSKRSAEAALIADSAAAMEAPPEAVPLVIVTPPAEPPAAPRPPMLQAAPLPSFGGAAMQPAAGAVAAPIQTTSYQQMAYVQQQPPVFSFQQAAMAARQPQFTVG